MQRRPLEGSLPVTSAQENVTGSARPRVLLESGKTQQLVGIPRGFSTRIPGLRCSCLGTGAVCAAPQPPDPSAGPRQEPEAGWEDGGSDRRWPPRLFHTVRHVRTCFCKVTGSRFRFSFHLQSSLLDTYQERLSRVPDIFICFGVRISSHLTLAGWHILQIKTSPHLAYWSGCAVSVWV